MSKYLVPFWRMQDICMFFRDAYRCNNKGNSNSFENGSCKENLCPIIRWIKEDENNCE